MGAKQASKRVRRRVILATAAVGLVAITAVVASSGAGATPFIPAVPGFHHAGATEASAQLDNLKFPLQYASQAISTNCGAGSSSCKGAPEPFTMTKQVDSTTPILAQSAASGKPYQRAEIIVRAPEKGELKPVITYTLEDVRVLDDHQVYDTTPNGGTLREVVTLHYAKITWAVGSTKAGRDFAANKNS
ncbi:MAG TPA: type VI secretion system tube protein Hcp [Solirubrobacteraceae bacterium]|jgi:type VI secretion system Hcp family effector